MQCYQCGRPPMYQIVIDGHKVNLCIDCQLKMEQIRSRQNEETERIINYLSDNMSAIAGIPSNGPRFPERTTINAEGTVLNNIHIQDSQIGVVNTGIVQTIDAAVTTIRESGNNDLSRAITELTEAVIGDESLPEKNQKEALDLVGIVSAEASLPKEDRRKAMIRPLVKEIGVLLQGSAAASVIYDKVLPMLQVLFQ